MSIQLTPQQQEQLDREFEGTPRIIDPRSNATYILIPEAEYDTACNVIEGESCRQTIHTSALRNAICRMNDVHDPCR